MKKPAKRVLVVILAAVLLLGALPVSAGADSSGVCFTVVDDQLLKLTMAPIFSGSEAYVSARVFANCGIYYTYFASSETAQLYTSTKNIFFDIANGTAYDENRNYYSASAFLSGGVAYVPVGWVCSYFGLTYSYITGKGVGDILRIKTGAAYLTDDYQYLTTASFLMQTYYYEAYGASKNDTPTNENPIRHDAVVTISFIGLPDEDTLKTLDKYGCKACFFITQEQAQSDTDLLRQLVVSGHSIGIYCSDSPNTTVFASQRAVFSAAQLLPTIVYSPSSLAEQCRSYAGENAMAYYSPDYTIAAGSTNANSAINELSRSANDFNILIDSVSGSSAYLSSLLGNLNTNEYTVLALRETSF